MTISSAAGIISLLDEPAPALKIYALQKLNTIVNEFWPEISDVIDKIEILHEDKVFEQHKLAALVASKVYYNLGSFEDSLTFALGAGDLFDVNARNEYVESIISKCIDQYIKLRKQQFEKPDINTMIDPRLETIVNRMFQRCLDDGQYRQALGLAVETCRLDIFEASIKQSDDVIGMMTYAFQIAMNLVPHLGFRNTVLRILIELYTGLSVPDYVNMCQCLIFLDDAEAVAQVLDKLSQGAEKNVLMAYQIAFDLYESATQQFLGRVLHSLRLTAPVPSAITDYLKSQTVDIIVPSLNDDATSTGTSQDPTKDETSSNFDDDNRKKVDLLDAKEKEHQDHIDKLSCILSGILSIDLHLQFLIRSNHSDLLILKNTKESVRASICHTATVIANAFQNAGTTSDHFLRDNLDWLARATNWAKFSATATLGVIHRGHEHESLALMQSYLPKEAGPTSGYSEGGGLYALGLIHANHGAKIIEYLLQQLKDARNEIVRHGGCLGLGLAGMGTHRFDVYDQLKFNLYQDNAVIGEAAGISMGLVMLGSLDDNVIMDMIKYAQESQHEKILRGLAVGISLTMFGCLQDAEPYIYKLLEDKDPILHRSAMYTIAMAYCGTGNNQAIRRLLHVAVSDVNDDVRRAAVTAIGFILFRTPEQCPSVVSLLAESYNPHVRYGAAMALGIACAGTGLREAVALLEPMIMFDAVNFVRQGALIASAMILIQQTEQTCPKVTSLRQTYSQVISNKHEDVMAKFGAILAQGIIDGGGRNVTLSMQSRTGHTNILAVVGTLLFTQYWYWFPLSHCLALAFTPTCVIGLNSELKMLKLDLKSNAKPSLYAYPPATEEKKREEKEKVATAVLSVAARAKRREHDKKHKEPEKMDVDEEKTEKEKEKEKPKEVAFKDTESTASAVKSDKKASEDKEKDKDKKEPEPTFEILSNPTRVMRQQLKTIQIVDSNKFVPLKDITIGGIVVIRNLSPESEELVEPVSAHGPKKEDENEPEPPEPFEWDE